jgi:uncharacterized membrane protein YqjE
VTTPEPSAPREPGLAGSLRDLGGTLLALIRTRVELIATELAEEKERRKEMLILAVVAALFLALGLLLLAFFVVVVFWDSYRLAATAGVTLLYLGIGAWALSRLRTLARDSPPTFAATLAEFENDAELLRGRRE